MSKLEKLIQFVDEYTAPETVVELTVEEARKEKLAVLIPNLMKHFRDLAHLIYVQKALYRDLVDDFAFEELLSYAGLTERDLDVEGLYPMTPAFDIVDFRLLELLLKGGIYDYFQRSGMTGLVNVTVELPLTLNKRTTVVVVVTYHKTVDGKRYKFKVRDTFEV